MTESIKQSAGPSNVTTLEPIRFSNKLSGGDKTTLSHTFTYGQTRDKKTPNEAHDSGFAINSVDGYFPRARSGGSIKTKIERVSRRFHSDSAVTRCDKLPAVVIPGSNNNGQDGTKKCLRPWSKTSIELQKYKETLQNT